MNIFFLQFCEAIGKRLEYGYDRQIYILVFYIAFVMLFLWEDGITDEAQTSCWYPY